MVQKKRNMTRLTEKLIRRVEQTLSASFHALRVSLAQRRSRDGGYKTKSRNYIDAPTHPDVSGCEDHFKNFRRAYLILNDDGAA